MNYPPPTVAARIITWLYWLCSIVLPIGALLEMSFRKRDFLGGFKHEWSNSGWMDLASSVALSAACRSVMYGMLTVAGCAALGIPLAILMFFASDKVRGRLSALLLFPLCLNSLLIAFNWQAVLGNSGFLNSYLISAGVINEPIAMLFRPGAVLLGMIGAYLPFFLFPVLTVITRLDRRYALAAAALGAGPWKTVLWVVLPLCRNGIFVGAFLVFLPSCAEFLLPDLLGGGKVLLLGNLLQFWFYEGRNWPAGASLALLLFVFGTLVVLPFVSFLKKMLVIEKQ